jgi:hypothetical protein
MLRANPMERRLQLCGILLILGLSVEALCLFWTRPLAFVLFLALGGLLFGLGMILFLFSLVSTAHQHSASPPGARSKPLP